MIAQIAFNQWTCMKNMERTTVWLYGNSTHLEPKTEFMQKSYNRHIVNVHLSDLACIMKEKETPKKERIEIRRASIGKVDKETEKEIKAYCCAKSRRIDFYVFRILDSKFENFNASEVETEAQLGNLTPKSNSGRINFQSAGKIESESKDQAKVQK